MARKVAFEQLGIKRWECVVCHCTYYSQPNENAPICCCKYACAKAVALMNKMQNDADKLRKRAGIGAEIPK
jgi:hypothetical protein